MSFMGGFGQGLQNSAQAMMLKQMMLRGQHAAPGAAQTPPNPYSGPQMGSPGGYDPQAMESAMDAALGKAPHPSNGPGIESSGMTAQAGTQLPPPNILANLKAAMMGTLQGPMMGGRRPEPWDTMGQIGWGITPDYGPNMGKGTFLSGIGGL